MIQEKLTLTMTRTFHATLLAINRIGRGAVGCYWEGAPLGAERMGVVKPLIVAGVWLLCHRAWIDMDGETLFRQATGNPVALLNNADAAGLAEVTFGAGRDGPNPIIVLIFGTGIGSTLIRNGSLLPNLELGHLWLWNGKAAEAWCSERTHTNKDLS